MFIGGIIKLESYPFRKSEPPLISAPTWMKEAVKPDAKSKRTGSEFTHWARPINTKGKLCSYFCMEVPHDGRHTTSTRAMLPVNPRNSEM